jgi:Ca-activated chloride channel family protein
MQVAAWYVLLLIPLILAMAWFGRRKPRAAVAIADAGALQAAHRTLRVRLLPWLSVLQVLAVVLLVAGLARPRIGKAESVQAAEGIDLVLAIDLSSSMDRGRIGTETRLEATKSVLEGFIESREEDRIGIVVFEKDALAYSPPSLDYDALVEIVRGLDSGILADGTAIGDGITTSLTMLRGSSAASQAIILLTDGVHNVESIHPLEAAEVARALRVPVYTIGVVDPDKDTAPSLLNEVDLELLEDVAEATDAKFFQATSKADLADIYEEIGMLETSKLGGESFQRWVEVGPWLLLAGAALLALVFALRGTWLRGAA